MTHRAAVMTLALVTLTSGPGGGQEEARQTISVTHHTDVTFGNADADQRLGDFNDVIRRKDRESDCACCVMLDRQENVGVFGTPGDGDDVILNQRQLRRVLNIRDARVKVVGSMCGVNLCGGDGQGCIKGCADRPGTTMAVTGTTAGDIWGHEFGHNQGLEHRNGSIRNLMHPTEPDTDEVDSGQCDSLRSSGATGTACVLAGRCP